MKILTLFPMIVVAAALPFSANAAQFVSSGGETVSGITTFDWAPSTVLADNGNQAFVDWVNTGGTCGGTITGCVFDVYAHGKLSNFLNRDGTTITSGVGTDYEITYVLGFSEKVVLDPITFSPVFGFGPNGGLSGPFDLATDAVMSDGSANFFAMYYDDNSATFANSLTGEGFSDGGNLLLAGQLLPDDNWVSFFTPDLAPPAPEIGGNWNGNAGETPPDWIAAGTDTVTGTGSSAALDLVAYITDPLNQAFFPNQSIETFLMSNISQQLAFNSTNPSMEFFETKDGVPIDTVAAIGPINGGTTGTPGSLVASGPSIIFQTDPNSPFSTPEPTGLALLGLGMLGLGAVRRRMARA